MQDLPLHKTYQLPGIISLSQAGEIRLSMIDAALVEGSVLITPAGIWWMIQFALGVENIAA